jgi:hypothetical protein
MVKTLDFVCLISKCITTQSLLEVEIRELMDDPENEREEGLLNYTYDDSLIFILNKVIDETKDEIPDFTEKFEDLKLAHISELPESELDPVMKSHSSLVMEFREVENVLLMTYKITAYDEINESFVEYNSGVISITDLPRPKNIVSNYLTKFIISVLNSVGNDLSLLSEELHARNRGSLSDAFPLFLTNYRYFAKELLISSHLNE